MTWDEYASAWSRLHGGFDPRTGSVFVRGWVRLAFTLGSRLAWAGPSWVTLCGLLICLAVPFAGLVPGAALVLLAALADTLDGAVAVLSDRATRAGYVLDSVADRVGEAAWLTAFWVGGAQAWVVVAAGAASWLHEYARARATAAGMSEIGAVTVGERPTRVLIAVFGLLGAGIAGHAPLVLTVAAAVWLGLAVIGLAQLAVAIRRSLD
ncbi:CDP-alcohol phosphatidyltransferase family protein [Actinoplanes sp. NPDC051343]|uniref:CDP-alcohol phosphatidyltransferase family protein n=1 Tax=Actinoplanes sp. NPDC051343 TaxID=3363906 RepID=UPI0037BCF4B3